MASPGGWTYKTALNALRRMRRRAVIEQRLLFRHAVSAAQPPPEWNGEVLAAVRALPERQRVAIALHYIGDLSVEDTAAVMKVKPGTVMATLHAARANLAKALAPDDPAYEEARRDR